MNRLLSRLLLVALGLSLAACDLGGGTSEIKSVSLAGRQYITNPITRAWQCLPPDTTFDPAILFDPAKGFEFLLQKGYENITLAGTETIDGRPNYHLTGTIKGELLTPISGGRIGAGLVKLDLWADTATKRATRLVLVDSATEAVGPTTWDIRFSEYDKAVDVQVPPGAQCA
jgi:lipoprotein LprG